MLPCPFHEMWRFPRFPASCPGKTVRWADALSRSGASWSLSNRDSGKDFVLSGLSDIAWISRVVDKLCPIKVASACERDTISNYEISAHILTVLTCLSASLIPFPITVFWNRSFGLPVDNLCILADIRESLQAIRLHGTVFP